VPHAPVTPYIYAPPEELKAAREKTNTLRSELFSNYESYCSPIREHAALERKVADERIEEYERAHTVPSVSPGQVALSAGDSDRASGSVLLTAQVEYMEPAPSRRSFRFDVPPDDGATLDFRREAAPAPPPAAEDELEPLDAGHGDNTFIASND
jgi:hypothetical protein